LSDRLIVDAVGFAAAGFVLATFCMRSMSALRWMAIASNLTFMTYGYLANLAPVLLLHALLFPINAYRLAQLFGKRDARAGAPEHLSFRSAPLARASEYPSRPN
jgi:hypothetical protein